MGGEPPMLFISGFLPSKRVPSGGQNLVARVLAETGRKRPVTLISFRNRQESPYYDPSEFASLRASHVMELTMGRRLFGALRHPTLPWITSARFWLGRGQVLECLRGASPPGEVWIEFIQAASLLRVVPKSVRTTLVVHDLFHQAIERRAEAAKGLRKLLLRWEAARTRQWEAAVLREPDTVLCINDKDRDLIARFAGRSDVEVRYPVVDERYRSIQRTPAKVRPGTMLFWGLMSRSENEDAAVWFVSDVLPRIRRERPDVTFLIAGASPSERVQALAGPGIRVLGFVDDPVPLFESAEVAVAPLRLGSGIKIKVLEFLAAGIPTVATRVGAEGVRPSEWLTVADSAEDFAAACIGSLGGSVR